MTHLLYASNEMFSSTQLIRKSKDIFDKLTNKEIQKAVILRDGKPNFMLIEFNEYEKIMKEYESLKKEFSINSHTKEQTTPDTINIVQNNENILKDDDKISNEILEDSVIQEKNSMEIKEEEELKIALAQIEALDLEPEFIKEAKDKLLEQAPAQIKEFWN